MKKRFLSLFAAAVFLCSCSAAKTTETRLAPDSDTLVQAVTAQKDKLDTTDAPYGVSAIYRGSDYDFNNDGIDDYAFAYALYSQFEFVVFDGICAECLLDERVMMDFIPNETLCEIYSDNSGKLARRFYSKLQKTAFSAPTETIQIVIENECHIFEAVYDKDTGDFIHAFDKYSSYEEYNSAQTKCLNEYSRTEAIVWEEYALSETASHTADNEFIIKRPQVFFNPYFKV